MKKIRDSPEGLIEQKKSVIHRLVAPKKELESLRKRISRLEKADVKQRKRAELKLRESEERFRLVAQSAIDAIISVDSCRKIIFWNKAATTIFGYSAGETVGKPLTMIMPERFKEKHQKGMNRVISTGETRIIGKMIEVAGLRKDGSEFPLELSLSKWRTGEGIFFTGIMRDITERKRIEAKLQRTNKRMKSDLATAEKVQKSLLPRESLRMEGVNFARAFKPCEELGGDILNVFPLDKKHVGFYVADISGHGVSAALLSVMLSRVMSSLPWQSSLLKQQIRGSSKYRLVPPGEVAEQLNLLFPMNSETRQFFTLLYGILNLETDEFRYVSAGHVGPIYLPHNSEPSILEEPGLPIGVLKEAAYEEHTVSMKPGDRLYLYSDGVTEATNSNDELFGKERLVNTLLQTRNIQLKDSIFCLLGSVEEWCGDIPPADDISIL